MITELETLFARRIEAYAEWKREMDECSAAESAIALRRYRAMEAWERIEAETEKALKDMKARKV